MPIDSNIALSYRPPEIESPLNQLAKVLQVKGLQGQQDLAAYTLKKAQREDEDNNALRTQLAAPGADPYNALLKIGRVKEAGEYQKSQNDSLKTKSDISHNDALTADQLFKTRIAKSDQAIKDISGFTSPQEALASLEQHATAGDIPPEQAQIIRQKLTTINNPADFRGWQLDMVKNIMSAKDRMALTVPDANAVLQAQTSTTNNAATNATSRANNRDTIAGENVRAGVMPGGGMDDNSERTAQAIASGQLPAPTGMALLNPKNQRILGRVMEINPQYDATTVDAKKKAARDFTSGPLGNQMRSFAVAGSHLDQLGTLVDALDNGNFPLVNQIGNAYSKQTGSPAVTNFDAAKDVVSKEVVKAIVAGGGGVAERQELSDLMKNANSPAQLKGVIKQYRNLMAAQHDALLVQRRSAGLPDSTIPKYGSEAAPGGAAPVAVDQAAIAAELKRREAQGK